MFSLSLIKGTIFGKKFVENKMFFFILSTKFLRKIYYSKNNSARHGLQNIQRSSHKVPCILVSV
jgi:hypothetical protein